MNNAEYRKHSGISKSDLHKISISPLHFRWSVDHKDEVKKTPSLIFGSAAHKYLLEEEDFFNEFSILPECDRRKKEGKEIYEKFVSESEGKEIISKEDFEKIKAMKEVIVSNKFASLLLSGEHEQSYFWIDEQTGEECKCRPDALYEKDDLKICIDYKTTSNAETQSFMNSAIKFGYDLQAGMYTEGLEKCKGGKYKFVFISQEVSAPYAMNILEADEYFMTEGNELFHDLLGIFHECKENDVWPGYMGANNEIQTLTVPKWLQKAVNIEEGDFE